MDLINQTFFKIGETTITFWSLIVFIFIILLTIFISVSLRKFLNKKVFPRYDINPGVGHSYSRIIYYFILISGLLLALNSAGLNISILFAGGAVLLVGIGFGVQNIVNNFISGLILLFERPIKEGDFVEVNGIFGTVVTISARSTRIITNANITIIVPNSKFLENNIVNWSYTNPTFIDVPVNVSYDSDFTKITDILLKIAGSHAKVLKDPGPSVSVSELGDCFIKAKLWVAITENKLNGIIRAEINKTLLEEFTKAGIKFPAPQRELVVLNK